MVFVLECERLELPVICDLERAFDLSLSLLRKTRNEASFYATLKDIHLVQLLFIFTLIFAQVHEAIRDDSNTVVDSSKVFFDLLMELINLGKLKLCFVGQVRFHAKIRV